MKDYFGRKISVGDTIAVAVAGGYLSIGKLVALKDVEAEEVLGVKMVKYGFTILPSYLGARKQSYKGVYDSRILKIEGEV